jgi:nitrogenase molybdenum-cofactor synthesis protein NifE
MTPREMYAMLRDARADIMLSGGRSQFVALKARMPWLDINQERHHAYAGYEGMVDLVREISRAIFNPVWQQVRIPAPWGDDGETLGVVQAINAAPVALAAEPVATPLSAMNYLTAVAAQSMGLEPEEVPA